MFGGRKFSINRHTGVPKPLTRRFSNVEPSMNGTSTLYQPYAILANVTSAPVYLFFASL
jgi:hypothetical protein